MYERESGDLWDIREQTGRLGDEWWSWEMGNNHYSTAACIRTYSTCTHIYSTLSLVCMRCDLSPNKHAHILKRGNAHLPTGSHNVHTRKGRVIYYTGKSHVSPWGAATFIITYFLYVLILDPKTIKWPTQLKNIYRFFLEVPVFEKGRRMSGIKKNISGSAASILISVHNESNGAGGVQ